MFNRIGAIARDSNAISIIGDGCAQVVAGEVSQAVQRIVLIFRVNIIGVRDALEIADVVVGVGGDSLVSVAHGGKAIQLVVSVGDVRAVGI